MSSPGNKGEKVVGAKETMAGMMARNEGKVIK